MNGSSRSMMMEETSGSSENAPRPVRSYGANNPTNYLVEEWPKSKKDLYDAARELFWENGFAETSIQEIVSHAGLTKGAFYHYFAAKEDVLQIMFERSLMRLMLTLERQREQEMTVLEALRALIEEMIAVANDYRVEVAMFWEQYRRLPEALAHSNLSRRRDFYRSVAGLVRRGIDNGELRAGLSPDVVAMSIIGVCQHSQHWLTSTRDITVPQLGSDVADMFLGGLAS